jgi:DNA-binding response OmpR family regulator
VRLLVVEDDLDTREMIEELAAMEGARVTSAADGRSGYEVFVRERPELVVSDLWMPAGDGFELIRRIRALAPEAGKLTPAVGLSACENARSAILAGYHAFLPKPFDLDRLVELIRDFVRIDSEGPQGDAPWTLSAAEPDVIQLTIVGHVRVGDVRRMMGALHVHLEAGAIDLVVDARRLTGFSPAGASVAERAVWDRRDRIRSVRYLGGTLLARVVVSGACALLGVPVTFAEAADGAGDA